MAAHFEHGEIGRADLAERDTGNAAIRFVDGFGDLAGFAAAAVPHTRRAYHADSLFVRLSGFRTSRTAVYV